MKNLRTSFDNNENQENARILFENHENHKNVKFHIKKTKIMKS